MPRTVGLFACLLLVASACVPAASQANRVVHYDPTKTKMGEIQQRGHIVIGIPNDYRPFGFVNGSGKPQGFTTGLGRLVAEALGVSARFIARPADQLLGMVDSDQADLVFPMLPITQTAAAAHPFSDPYYLAHQRLLVPRGSPIQEVSDLGGKTVCSAIDPETEVKLSRLDPSLSLLPVSRAASCAGPLRSGRVAAATGPDVALYGLRYRLTGSAIVGGQITTEGYGAAVGACNPGLAQFATRVFAVAKKDGAWTTLYKRWVLPATGTNLVPNPPSLTDIDAWDLFPTPPGAPSPTPAACPSP
ncbi:MAG: transporter substrate-binding domain-containing protein [Actinomycetota bacterium]|nr:transporter substrate-binding domain-containing protein [Actinomycetota bacterium]